MYSGSSLGFDNFLLRPTSLSPASLLATSASDRVQLWPSKADVLLSSFSSFFIAISWLPSCAPTTTLWEARGRGEQGRMWGRGFVHGLGGLGLPFGSGRLPPPRSASTGAGAGEESLPTSTQKWQFPVKAGVTSGGLALVGDTVAQLYGRYESRKSTQDFSSRKSTLSDDNFWQHDWVRSLRMASYGFLLYGPLSDWWYVLLEKKLPAKTLQNFSLKVLLNQLVLGPIVIAIVFAWNSAWQGRLSNLPDMYRNQALGTLMDGWKFWTPVSFLNFGVVPLDARVAFMSTCAICWNFYISTVVSKK